MRKFGRLTTILLLAGASASAQKEFVAAPEESIRPDELIVKLKPGANVSVLTSLAPGLRSLAIGSHGNIHLLQLPPGLRILLSRLIGSLRQVEFVEPNRVRSVELASPNDPGHSSQWALQTIRALQAWNYLPDRYLTAATAGANRVKIAVLDTGADCTHPDFKNSGGTSTDSANGGQLLFAGSQALVATTTPSPACSWQDDHGHGTHVAGTVAAATHNGTGLASVGYPLQVVVYKVLDVNGEAADATIAAAIEAAADNGAQVISLSLGGTGYSQTLQTAIDYAWQRNSLVVAASGNTGGSQLVFPGAANHAVSVAATDSFNARASFSTYGNWVKIAAPGVNILSMLPTYTNKAGALNYGYLSGTSMATPHVAAVAGLVYMANPGISAAAVAQRLQRSALSTAAGWNQFTGYGVLHAAGAVTGQLRVSATQGSFTGQVVDADGLPMTGAVVTAGGRAFMTAPDGLFRLANLEAGSFTVTATAPGFSPVNLQSAIVAGADTMLTLQMGVPAGQFTGSVAHNGSAVPGAIVQAVSGGLIRAVTVTDQAGLYSLQVPPGTYELSASAAGYVTGAAPGQTIGAGASATVNLAIAQYGRIAGMALDSGGSPTPGAHITITGTNFSSGTTSDGDGNFTSLGLPPGNYMVTASASGYPNSAPVTVTVVLDTTTVANPQFATTIPSLIGHWRFDEGSGTTAGDASGSGWNATISGAVWAAGKLNGGLAFNGTSAHVATPTIPLPTTFSISAWVNPAALTQTGYGRIVETRFNSGFFLGINASGTKYKFIVREGSGSTAGCGAAFGCVEGGTIAAGWHFLTGTYNGTTARLFVDGVLVATDTATLPSPASYPMVIGRFYGGNGYGWNGAIDDVRLFNRAITSTDVSNLFNAVGSPAVGLSPASLTFASQAVGTTSSSQSVTLTNTGTAPLSISSIAVTGSHAADFAQTNNCGASLAASANCSISVTFTPSAAGARSASIFITDSAAGSPHSVTLGGAGAVAGLTGYWAFDDGNGVTAADTSGNNRNASVSGATWTAGKINGGLSFGAGKYAVTPAIPLSNTFTISVWVNAAALTQTGYARIAETQYGSGFYLGVNAAGNKFKFIVKGGIGTTGGCGAVYGCVESGAITAGWHLLTGTYDGTTARLYVDGALAASDTAAAPANTNLPLYLGRFYGGNSYFWNGAMDDVRLYTAALTVGEVSALFAAGNPVP